MKKIVLTLAYLLLLGLVVAEGVFFYFKLDKIEQNITDLQAFAQTNQLPNQDKLLSPQGDHVVDLPSLEGTDNVPLLNTPDEVKDQPIPNSSVGQNQLSNHNTYLTISSAGQPFTASATPIFKSASVPEVAQLANGDLYLYFVDASTLTSPGTERLAFTQSSDQGVTWSEKQLITLSGKQNAGAAVDPSVVQLADGTLRMYFFGSETTQGDPASVEGDHVVYSAVSTDGINWAVEEGQRFAAPKLTDPEVVQLSEDYWVMYYAVGTTTGITTSSDGLTFTDTGKIWTGGGIPGAHVDAQNTVHLYGCSILGLRTARAGVKSA